MLLAAYKEECKLNLISVAFSPRYQFSRQRTGRSKMMQEVLNQSINAIARILSLRVCCKVRRVIGVVLSWPRYHISHPKSRVQYVVYYARWGKNLLRCIPKPPQGQACQISDRMGSDWLYLHLPLPPTQGVLRTQIPAVWLAGPNTR